MKRRTAVLIRRVDRRSLVEELAHFICLTSPGAARGGRDVDGRGDAFAFGIIAYELLTGRAPFKVPPVLLAMTGQSAPQPPMDGIDERIAAAIESCLSTDPAARPTMGKIIAHLSG